MIVTRKSIRSASVRTGEFPGHHTVPEKIVDQRTLGGRRRQLRSPLSSGTLEPIVVLLGRLARLLNAFSMRLSGDALMHNLKGN